MTLLRPDEPLVEGAYYEDADGDIIGPMKTMSGGDRWTGRSREGAVRARSYFKGGLSSPGRALIRRALPPAARLNASSIVSWSNPSPPKTGGYNYATERHTVFTDAGQRQFLGIRDRSKSLLKTAGAFRLQEVIAGETGDSWRMLACVDRLVELGEIVEITTPGVPGQFRIFTT